MARRDLIVLESGIVHDPTNGIDGRVMDLWMENGRIVPPPNRLEKEEATVRRIDATGYVVMPGGVDIHSHIAGPKVNLARRMRPEDKRQSGPVERHVSARAATRSGSTGSVPSTFATGYLYSGLGYTTAFDAAIAPLAARHAHEEFRDTPLIDKGFFILLGNNHYALTQIAKGEKERLRAFAGWILQAAGAHAIKVVNPGGVEAWKSGMGNIHSLDEPIPHFGCTARQVVTGLAQAAMDLNLPHPIHLHCNNLGLPGNFNTTLATMQALEGRRAHFTHIQFHSYGGETPDQSSFCSRAPELAEWFNNHPEITVDVGQVMFGETTSMTGDGPLGYFLHKVTGRRWTSADTELEAGCGIVPITYREKKLVHALQWAIGLEWYLLARDPWRIAMSTDHPNGSSFLAYPEIIALLMDRGYRDEALKATHPGVRQRCRLAELDREYTLNEIAIITRAAPARMLGLVTKGHLGPGADADITLYQPDHDKRRMFALPRMVIKAGRVVVDDGNILSDEEAPLPTRTWLVRPDFDRDAIPDIRTWFENHYTLRFDNYPVERERLAPVEALAPCGNKSR